jgi:hypothetical protein
MKTYTSTFYPLAYSTIGRRSRCQATLTRNGHSRSHVVRGLATRSSSSLNGVTLAIFRIALIIYPGRSLLSEVPEPGHSFLSFPIFFGLTAQVIPLRSGLRVFCFVGSALNSIGFPPTMQTLACDSTPPRSLSCPKENGAERKGKNKMSYLYVKWNRSGLQFAR